jgi:hypothetical protein
VPCRRRLSGSTCATAGSAASCAAWSGVTVAENALPSAKCLTLAGAVPASLASTDSCCWVALARRVPEAALVAGASGSWSLRTTITDCGALLA